MISLSENISDFSVSDCIAGQVGQGGDLLLLWCTASNGKQKITENSIYWNLNFKHIWWYSQKLCLSHSPGQKYVLFPAVPSFHAIMLPILLLKRIMYIIYLLHRSSFLWPLITFSDVAPLSSAKARVIRFCEEIASGKSGSVKRTDQWKKEGKYVRLDAIEQGGGDLWWKVKERVCRIKFCLHSFI